MRIVLLFNLIILFCSCSVESHFFGKYEKQKGQSEVYMKGKDIYLFWNKVPLQKLENKIEISDYEKIVRRNLFDNVVYYGSVGVFSFYTVKIKVKESPAQKK